MTEHWPDGQEILDMTAGFQSTCVVGAAAELDVFSILAPAAMSAQQVAEALGGDTRAVTMLLDALAALRLLQKDNQQYTLPEPLRPWLVEDSPQTVLPMIRHRMNIMRSWAQLAWVAKSGAPAERPASIRGAEADQASFIAAMHTVSGPVADGLIARVAPPQFSHLLDVGGASGTWTLALLRAVDGARATIFDLPHAIEQARQRIAESEMADRITLVAGDFYTDALPGGVDFAWVSAICHQHSRQHNRELFAKVHTALLPGGTIAIRDVVMEPCRTKPVAGAMFAINMLVNTASGGTFTFDEYAEDLRSAGFEGAELRVKHEAMGSVVVARKG